MSSMFKCALEFSAFGQFFYYMYEIFYKYILTQSCIFYFRMSSGHQTLGRLPSHSAHMTGPNNGKYATLSKQCKTLESNDFY